MSQPLSLPTVPRWVPILGVKLEVGTIPGIHEGQQHLLNASHGSSICSVILLAPSGSSHYSAHCVDELVEAPGRPGFEP
jgi:hypothetical protein